MATPHVAGGVALAYSLMGDASAVEVKDLILSTTRAIPSLAGRCVTGGVLDVEAALESTFLGPQIELISSVPAEVDPGVAVQVRVRVTPREDQVLQGSVQLRYRSQAGIWGAIEMQQEGPCNFWTANVPAMDCGDEPSSTSAAKGRSQDWSSIHRVAWSMPTTGWSAVSWSRSRTTGRPMGTGRSVAMPQTDSGIAASPSTATGVIPRPTGTDPAHAG